MSATKHYLEDLATKAADAVWTEIMNESDKARTTYSEEWCMVADTVFTDMESLFDDLWLIVSMRSNMEKEMPKTYAVCKELAKWMPEHLDTMWDLNPDLTPIE